MSGGAGWGRTGERLERSEWGRGEAAREGEGGRGEKIRSEIDHPGLVWARLCISNTLRTYLRAYSYIGVKIEDWKKERKR